MAEVRIAKQLAIIRRLQMLLEGITPANGYDLDLANRVHVNRVAFGRETPPPFLSILESPEPENPISADLLDTYVRFDWPLWVQGWVHNDDFSTLYALKAAVEKRLSALATRSDTFFMAGIDSSGTPLLSGARIAPGVVRPADPQRGATAYMFVALRCHVVLSFRNPYVSLSL